MAYNFREPLTDPANPSVDIVFVHGLGGHPRNTWTSNNVFWPQKLLSSAVPEARVFSWTHNAKLTGIWSSKQQADEKSMADIARDLLADLAGVRQNSQERPMFFVAHSLGGLICAEALLLAPNLDEDIQKVGQNIRGIVFFGTPLRGSKQADWAMMASRFGKMLGRKGSEMPSDLARRSTRLIELTEKFSSLLLQRNQSKHQNIKALFFYEARSTWVAKVDLGKIVEKDSARIDGYPSLQIPADHRDMCKWENEEEEGFQRLVDTLRSWLKSLASSTSEANGSHTNYYTLHGSTFNKPNYGGAQIGNALSTGPSPAVTQQNTNNARWANDDSD